jgi:hypothetical protein
MRERRLKAFFGGALMLPSGWCNARQGDVLAYAESKADLERLLIEVDAPTWATTEIPKQARWWRGGSVPPGGTTWGRVIAAGAIDPTRRGVYVAPMAMVKGALVAEIMGGGAVPVARIEYDSKYDGRGLYAESLR